MKSDEIAQVKEKKIALESCIKSLEANIETYSIAAEEKNDLSLLTKANLFRKTVREKENTLEDIEKFLRDWTKNSKIYRFSKSIFCRDSLNGIVSFSNFQRIKLKLLS